MHIFQTWLLLTCLNYIFSKPMLNGAKMESDYSSNNQLFHSGMKNKDYLGGLSAVKSSYCRTTATCQPLNYTTCFGTKLPYSGTSLSLVAGLRIRTQEEAQEKLSQWRGLIHLPKCWAVIQSYLCALYMPKCEDGYVNLPSMEMCEIIQGPCRILKTDDLWPVELVCNSTFPSDCKNEVRELKFNTTGHCKLPLVQAEQETSFYDGIEGCGVQCHEPLFTDEQRQEIRSIVIYGSFLSFFFNLFAVLTFAIDWKSANKYPSEAIFYINFCYLMVSVGYLYQFRPGAGDHTVCHKDGTLRTSEPSIRENLSCVTSFVFAYYFLIAGIVWFVIYAYAWQLSSQTVGKFKERKDKKGPYYHLVAWSLPLVLTITIMALGEVDGDSLFGICFVGVVNKQMRAIFLLGPLLSSLVGYYFFGKALQESNAPSEIAEMPLNLCSVVCIWDGLITLVRLKITSKDIISKSASSKICENISRISVFSMSAFLFSVIIFICTIYDFQNHQSWKESFRKLLICRLGVVGDVEIERCKLASGPSVLMVQLQLLALFGTHIFMALLWIFSHSAMRAWTSFVLSKIMNQNLEEEIVLKKHKVIARAFAKRKLMNSDGRLSISICNSHKDPLGLNFELNSLASNNLSTTWAKALPKLITRRGALITLPGSNSSYRRNSADSEISYSVRRVSVESRRHSCDSTVSVKAVEVNLKRKKRRKGKPLSPRSKYRSCSQDSNLENEVLTALNMVQCSGSPNMDRRPAISGIDIGTIKLLLDAAENSIASDEDGDSDLNSESDEESGS